MKVILGSASPRRQKLLRKIYTDFLTVPADIDETLPEDIGPEFAPIFLSAQKAQALVEAYPEDLILTADTVVVCKGEIFGKPKDNDDAKKMLTALSGEVHKVITGCCISCKGKYRTFSEETLVSFYPLTEEEIADYVQTEESLGKAGAYAIQEKGGLFVQKIEGDYDNVVGFPIARLYREIKDFLENEVE